MTQELVWTTLEELEALAFKMRTQKAIVRAALLSNWTCDAGEYEWDHEWDHDWDRGRKWDHDWDWQQQCDNKQNLERRTGVRHTHSHSLTLTHNSLTTHSHSLTLTHTRGHSHSHSLTRMTGGA